MVTNTLNELKHRRIRHTTPVSPLELLTRPRLIRSCLLKLALMKVLWPLHQSVTELKATLVRAETFCASYLFRSSTWPRFNQACTTSSATQIPLYSSTCRCLGNTSIKPTHSLERLNWSQYHLIRRRTGLTQISIPCPPLWINLLQHSK